MTDSPTPVTSSIYTEEEQKILNLVKDTRIAIINDMTSEGKTVPDNVGQIRVLGEILSAVDKAVVDTATIRVKQEEAHNTGATTAMVVELLKRSRTMQQQFVGDGKAPTIESTAAKVELVPGETEVSPEQLDPSDFVTPIFNPDAAGD